MDEVHSKLLGALSARSVELIVSGEMSVSFHLTSTGVDSWARSLKPHPRLGVATHTSFEVDQLTDLLRKVVTDKGGVQLPIRKEKVKVPIEKDSMNPSQVIHEVERLGLGTHKNPTGVTTQLPKGSLTYIDLIRGGRDLSLRAQAVAIAITHQKAVARITTGITLGVTGARDLHEWWAKSSASQKWTLLTKGKAAGSPPKTCGSDGLNERFRTTLQDLKCPFRDPESLVVKEAETESEYEYNSHSE